MQERFQFLFLFFLIYSIFMLHILENIMTILQRRLTMNQKYINKSY